MKPGLVDIVKAGMEYGDVQEVWSDTFAVSMNDFTATLDLGKRGLKAGEAIRYEYRVRMPLAQLKAMALMSLRLVRSYEAQAGVTISLPPKLLEAFGIPQEDWDRLTLVAPGIGPPVPRRYIGRGKAYWRPV